jgi:hypothetical protein
MNGFWQANRSRFEVITFWPRVMMIPITLALGALIFVVTRKLFGQAAAVISVAIYVVFGNSIYLYRVR